jgi:hypothetical protein
MVLRKDNPSKNENLKIMPVTCKDSSERNRAELLREKYPYGDKNDSE